jgi:thymidylate kinase
MKKNKFCVCLSGLDGSGKTFITNKLIEIYGKENKVKHVWSRYKNYTSKPLLLLARITGHNYKETINGIKVGYHDFHTSKILSIFFLFFQWIDQFFEIICRFKFTKLSIISDRSLIDTLIDISVDTNMEKFIFSSYAKSLFKFMPQNTFYIIIERDLDLIKKKRPDVFYDKNTIKKHVLFNKISKKYPIHIINNNNDIEITLKNICKIINQ